MAIEQLNYYSQTDTSIEDMQFTLDKVFIGHHQVSLTNYNSTSESQIAAGSNIEVNGTFYKITTDTAISGSPSDGTVYIYCVPSGDPSLGTATFTPTYTNTAPTWSDSKQGWYGTGGSANYRYLEFIMTKSTTTWSNKRIFLYDFNINELSLNEFTTKSNNSYFMLNNLTGSLSLFDVSTTLPNNGSATYNFQVFKPCRIWIELDSNRASGAGTDTATATLKNKFDTYTGQTLSSITVTTTSGLTRDQNYIIYDLGVGYCTLIITHSPGGTGSFRKRANIVSVAGETNSPILNDVISII